MTEKLKKGYLQWRCRRGTKELDVMLINFLDANYANLTAQELNSFNQLLDTQDTLLWELLIGKSTSSDKTIQTIIDKIITF